MSQVFFPNVGWTNIVTGMKVVFHPKVFIEPYAPHYDKYAGHVFEIVAFHDGDHVELRCISNPGLNMSGYVHSNELQVPWQRVKC